MYQSSHLRLKWKYKDDRTLWELPIQHKNRWNSILCSQWLWFIRTSGTSNLNPGLVCVPGSMTTYLSMTYIIDCNNYGRHKALTLTHLVFSQPSLLHLCRCNKNVCLKSQHLCKIHVNLFRLQQGMHGKPWRDNYWRFGQWRQLDLLLPFLLCKWWVHDLDVIMFVCVLGQGRQRCLFLAKSCGSCYCMLVSTHNL